MKKNFKKVLLSVSLFSASLFTLSSCGKEQYKGRELYFTGNTKDFSATDSSFDLVKNGSTNYKIVISETAGETIKTARDELIYFFEKATGITLNWLTDRDLSHTDEQYLISIGETNLFKTSGISIDKLELGNDGLIIKTVDKNVYICGGSDFGSLYGVYDFLKLNFNYEQYTHKAMYIDTEVKNLKLKNFNVKDIPDIPMRCHSYGFMGKGGSDYDEKMYGTRMRQDRVRNDHRMPIHQDFSAGSPSAKSTNSNTVIPIATYGTEHPKWFSNNSGQGKEAQLCYTAHGDETELELLIEEVAKKIEFSMQTYDPEHYPTLNCALVMMEDNYNICSCDACIRSKEKYNADSGAVVLFFNRVAEKVLAWQDLEENAAYKREDIKICFNAYLTLEEAPAHYDETLGKYVPNAPECEMNPHVGVYFAEMDNLDNQQSFFCDFNKQGKAIFDGWAALTKWLELWVYETDFACGCYFYDSFAFSTSQFYNYIASQNVKLIFSQGIDSDGACGWTGICWNQLKAYLNSKLSWDSTLDQDVLVNNFFKNVYKDAAPTMRKLFNTMRSYYAYLMETFPELRKLRSVFTRFNTKSADYYPLATLQSFVNIVDEALLEVEKYKANKDIYEPLFREIEAQAIFPLYASLELHSSEMSPDIRNGIIDRLIYDISVLNLSSCQLKEAGETLVSAVNAYK